MNRSTPIIRTILLYILVFFYTYQVCFNFFPGRLKTGMVIGMLGMVYSLIKYKKFGNPRIVNVANLSIPIFVWSIISMFINMHFDSYFPRGMILNIVYAFGAFFIVDCFKINSISKIIKIMLVCIIINNSIALIGLFIPWLKEFLVNIQSFESEYDLIKMARAVSFGNIFFGGGVISGLGIIMCCYLYQKNDISFVVFILIVLYLLITGVLIARTTLIGLVGLMMLLYPFKHFLKIGPILIGIFIIMGSSIFVLRACSENLFGADVTHFAFALIDNYQDKGDVRSGSLGLMLDMYKVIPDNVITWLIGDGFWNTPDGAYYMNIDIGYLRIIFCMGIIGLVLYIFLHYKLMQQVYKYSGKDKIVLSYLCAIFLYMLVLLGKGEVSFSKGLILLYLTAYSNNRLKRSLLYDNSSCRKSE